MVDGRNVGECCSESLESPLKVTRTVDVLRRGSRVVALTTSGSFPVSSFPNLDIDADESRRESELLRSIICSRGLRRWSGMDVTIWRRTNW